jgi:hypothetical protein
MWGVRPKSLWAQSEACLTPTDPLWVRRHLAIMGQRSEVP